jgi:dTDP-4-amino-4,6-dideoxygalactose transaminase
MVPAYTCPDVVSAIHWAGATATVVDIQPDSPWLNLADVSSCISRDIVAIIAPHFLGMPQPLSALDALSRERGIVLIEDSAQMGILSPAFAPSSDLVILSFGRGKPAPVGGGALLYKTGLQSLVEHAVQDLETDIRRAWKWRLRMFLQNLAMTRTGYRLLRSIPNLHVGETRYRQLEAVSLLSGGGVLLAAKAVASSGRETRAEVALNRMVSSTTLLDLPKKLGWSHDYPLLRYPVLARDVDARDSLIEAIARQGVAATKLYGRPLPELSSMPTLKVPFGYPNASRFADRLLTFPCHSDVAPSDIDALLNCLRRHCPRQPARS